jgi:hypothetical protein
VSEGDVAPPRDTFSKTDERAVLTLRLAVFCRTVMKVSNMHRSGGITRILLPTRLILQGESMKTISLVQLVADSSSCDTIKSTGAFRSCFVNINASHSAQDHQPKAITGVYQFETDKLLLSRSRNIYNSSTNNYCWMSCPDFQISS